MATPEAGWYDDGTGNQRWWDGARWTEHYVDLKQRDIELRAGAVPATAPAAPGWYDDGRGRHRWWDGARWTDAVRYSGEEQSLAGVTVDGRWIHFGAMSQPVADVKASFESGAELIKRGRLAKPATSRNLYGSSGLITPGQLKRSVVSEWNYLIVETSPQVWLAAVPGAQDAEGRPFTNWINNVSDHYRYR